ncbi:MAG: bifunctional 5,10-methylenetetrahydrofolate dehydrogenase/5,10-methenyltetrahydrofolate cyclohydrolase [Candidatus Saccharimonas sp.]
MTRELNGLELQGFIKERQARQVRNLRQQHKIIPKLLIIMSDTAAASSDTYVRMKQRYANDILIEVDVAVLAEDAMAARIAAANNDNAIHGIIVQLPLANTEITDTVCATIAPEKDVDGLGPKSDYCSATAVAIDWLLAGYNIDLPAQRIAILGKGRLVGAPLARLWLQRGLTVVSLDEHSKHIPKVLRKSSLVVAATGVPGVLTAEHIAQKAIVVDAGSAVENGQLVGDVDASVRARRDVTTTPVKGGVGPLTVAVLFDHVLQSALKMALK